MYNKPKLFDNSKTSLTIGRSKMCLLEQNHLEQKRKPPKIALDKRGASGNQATDEQAE
jgi:hypothetical protein